MFSDKESYFDVAGPVKFYETHKNGMVVENFEPEVEGVMNALIPEDFNLNIETLGDIVGHNNGDSKLVAMEVHLCSH